MRINITFLQRCQGVAPYRLIQQISIEINCMSCENKSKGSYQQLTYLEYKVIRKECNKVFFKLQCNSDMESTVLEVENLL